MKKETIFLAVAVLAALGVVLYFANRNRAAALDTTLPSSGATEPTNAERNAALATAIGGAATGVAAGIAGYAS